MIPSQMLDRPAGSDDPHAGVNGAPVSADLAAIAGVADAGPLAINHPGPTPSRPQGAGGFYLVAAMSTVISADTSWLFFGQILHVTDWRERVGMFAVLEVALVACGYGMRANVRRTNGTPGTPRALAWLLCAVSGYMAVTVAGLVAGLARVALGPALGLAALHLALGIEIRAHLGRRLGTLARVGRELRERALSRLGLADDSRDAMCRTRDRAAARAARLATASRTPVRRRRLARAVRASGATLDPARRASLIEQVATLRHLDDLRTAVWPSPWCAEVPPAAEEDVPAEGSGGADAEDAAGTSERNIGRKSIGSTRRNNGRKSAPARTRRPAEETRERIAELRALKPDMTQAEIAKLLGISDRQLRNVERVNGRNPAAGADLTEGANR